MSIDRARPPAVDAAAGGAWHAPARLARRCAPADDAIRSAGAARGRARRRRAPGPGRRSGTARSSTPTRSRCGNGPSPSGMPRRRWWGCPGCLSPTPILRGRGWRPALSRARIVRGFGPAAVLTADEHAAEVCRSARATVLRPGIDSPPHGNGSR